SGEPVQVDAEMDGAGLAGRRRRPWYRPGQGPVQLHGWGVPLEFRQVVEQSVGEMPGIDKTAEQVRCADVGEHRGGGDALAVAGRDAARPAVDDVDAINRNAEAQLAAGGAQAADQRIGDGAGATARNRETGG